MLKWLENNHRFSGVKLFVARQAVALAPEAPTPPGQLLLHVMRAISHVDDLGTSPAAMGTHERFRSDHQGNPTKRCHARTANPVKPIHFNHLNFCDWC